MRSDRSPIFLLLWAVALSGCQLASRQGPVSKAMVLSRQLSQQGVSAMERGQWQQAKDKLAQAVETCPADPDARRQYAEALWHHGEYDDALKQLEEANRLAGDDALLGALIAEKHLAMGQIELARRAADHAIDLDPHLAESWSSHGRVLRAAGDPRQALADLHRALSLNPEDRGVRLEIAELYRQLNEPLRALAALESLADTWPPGEEPQQILYLEGLAYAALDRNEDAVGCFSAACDRAPPTPEILCRLAEAQWRAGRPAQAGATAREALSLDPRHKPSHELLARLESATQPQATAMR